MDEFMTRFLLGFVLLMKHISSYSLTQAVAPLFNDVEGGKWESRQDAA
jgi:hypothetical protein